MEWEQFHNTGEWRAVKDVSVELSEPMLLSPARLTGRPAPGAGYRRMLAGLWLRMAVSAARDALRRRVVGQVDTRDLESMIAEASSYGPGWTASRLAATTHGGGGGGGGGADAEGGCDSDMEDSSSG